MILIKVFQQNIILFEFVQQIEKVLFELETFSRRIIKRVNIRVKSSLPIVTLSPVFNI